MDDIAFSELQRHGRVADLKVYRSESLIFNIFGVIHYLDWFVDTRPVLAML